MRRGKVYELNFDPPTDQLPAASTTGSGSTRLGTRRPDAYNKRFHPQGGPFTSQRADGVRAPAEQTNLVPRPPTHSSQGAFSKSGRERSGSNASRAGRASSNFSKFGKFNPSSVLLKGRMAPDDRNLNARTHLYNLHSDSWSIEASTRPPVLSTIPLSTKKTITRCDQESDGRKSVATIMQKVTSRLDALRQSVTDGNEYPALLTEHTHTRAGPNISDRSCYPAPARIGAILSPSVGTLHLSSDKSIFFRVKRLRASSKDDARPHSVKVSHINWKGLPIPTAAPGPTGGRSAPAVEISLTSRRHDGAKPILVYEMLENDAKRNRSKMDQTWDSCFLARK